MAKSKNRNFDPIKLNPFKSKDPDVTYAVIETPMSSPNNFKFDEKIGTYTLAGVLPQGMRFPHAFGFVPGTRAANGDPEESSLLWSCQFSPGAWFPPDCLKSSKRSSQRKKLYATID